MTETLSTSERGIIEHALGIEYKIGRNRKAYRDYYCCAKGDPQLESLVARGLMRRGNTINDGDMQYYLVTEAGAAAVESKLPT